MRYFFHIHIMNGHSEVDDVGCDFPSEALAINEARRLARELMSQSARVGNKLRHSVELADEDGRLIVRFDGEAEIRVTELPASDQPP